MTLMADSRISALDAGIVKIGHFRINRMGFGAMRITGPGIWGPPADMANAKRVLREAVELDVNLIDTADAYGPEVSEKLIRSALFPYDGLVIATKGGLTRGGPGIWTPNGTPAYLRQACEASLRRLGVGQITLYQLHRPDPSVPFEISLRTLMELQKAGKIRYIGLSNVSLVQLKQALSMTEIVSVQNNYNIRHRQNSEAIVDFCEAHNIAFIPYFPIGGSVGGVSGGIIQAVADKHQATPRQIALAWLLARSPIMLPIPGTGSVHHLQENIAATQIQLDEQDLVDLDTLSD
jgi:pyridoxine 4-dehydrogenase